MIYLFAGHHISNNKGTGAITSQFDEARLAIELRNLVTLKLRERKEIVWNDLDFKPQFEEIKKIKNWVQIGDVVVDFHFNSANSNLASGVEVFVPASMKPLNVEFAARLAQVTSEVLSNNLRKSKMNLPPGVKTEYETQHLDRGLHLMQAFKHTGALICLVEPCFITNENEIRVYLSKSTELAKKYADIIYEFHKKAQAALSA